jgi:Ca-activated chloride channel family protein
MSLSPWYGVLGPAFLLFALGAPRQQPSSERFRFRAEVNSVLLPVSVKDASGVPVVGLPESAFTVRDEGQVRPLVYFDERSEPLSVVLALDVSSSMSGDRLEQAKLAAKAFLARVGAEELALVAFDEGARVLVPWSEKDEEVSLSIDELTARGGTALYDALETALSLLDQAQHRRTALVLLSDGKDEDSGTSFAELRPRLDRLPAAIYSVGFYTDEERRFYPADRKHYKEPAFDVNLNPAWVLGELASSTGGLAIYPTRGEDLTPVFLAIATELRHQYLLGFEPAVGDSNGGEFRNIEVEVESAGHKSPLQVRTRRGYQRAMDSGPPSSAPVDRAPQCSGEPQTQRSPDATSSTACCWSCDRPPIDVAFPRPRYRGAGALGAGISPRHPFRARCRAQDVERGLCYAGNEPRHHCPTLLARADTDEDSNDTHSARLGQDLPSDSHRGHDGGGRVAGGRGPGRFRVAGHRRIRDDPVRK